MKIGTEPVTSVVLHQLSYKNSLVRMQQCSKPASMVRNSIKATHPACNNALLERKRDGFSIIFMPGSRKCTTQLFFNWSFFKISFTDLNIRIPLCSAIKNSSIRKYFSIALIEMVTLYTVSKVTTTSWSKITG